MTTLKWARGIGYSAIAAGLFAMVSLISGPFGQTASDTKINPFKTINYSTQSSEMSGGKSEDAIDHANSLSAAFRSASEKVLPAVVAIETRMENQVSMNPQGDVNPFEGSPFEGTPFEDFFPNGRQFKMPKDFRHQSPQPRVGIGSGVIVHPSGVILTNNHVVMDGKGKVTVRLNDGREFPAVEVVTDPKTDIAVIRIEGATNLQSAKMGDSDRVEIGDWVLALGQPFGLESTVTAGIISAKHRGIGITDRENFLQTDAAINPGNSGGPLVDLKGRIVGINTAISSRSGGNDGIGFAVPINLARWIGDQLIENGTVRRAYLGVGIQPVDHDLANQFNVKPRSGVVVTQVQPNTPAAKAGLKTGDVILAIDGKKFKNPRQFQLAVERSKIGEKHQLEILRGDQRMNLSFVPIASATEQPVSTSGPATQQGGGLTDELGFQVGALDAAVAKQLGMSDTAGVVITSVTAGGPAAEAGLKPGAVIIQANRKAISNLDDFTNAIKDASATEGVLLLVKTDLGSRFIVLKS